MTDLPLTVRERVEAVIRLHAHTNPADPLSISKVCRDAQVNRGNLYAYYPELLDSIRSTWSPKTSAPPAAANPVANRPEPARMDKELIYLCLELRAEVEALKKRLACEPMAGPKKPDGR